MDRVEPAPAYPSHRGREDQAPEPLWREVLGARLRHLRRERQLTLAATAAQAGISVQYLSEIERGRKEPSSEVISAVLGALGTSLEEVTGLVSLDLTTVARLPMHQPVRPVVTQRLDGPVALAA